MSTAAPISDSTISKFVSEVAKAEFRKLPILGLFYNRVRLDCADHVNVIPARGYEKFSRDWTEISEPVRAGISEYLLNDYSAALRTKTKKVVQRLEAAVIDDLVDIADHPTYYCGKPLEVADQPHVVGWDGLETDFGRCQRYARKATEDRAVAYIQGIAPGLTAFVSLDSFFLRSMHPNLLGAYVDQCGTEISFIGGWHFWPLNDIVFLKVTA